MARFDWPRALSNRKQLVNLLRGNVSKLIISVCAFGFTTIQKLTPEQTGILFELAPIWVPNSINAAAKAKIAKIREKLSKKVVRLEFEAPPMIYIK